MYNTAPARYDVALWRSPLASGANGLAPGALSYVLNPELGGASSGQPGRGPSPHSQVYRYRQGYGQAVEHNVKVFWGHVAGNVLIWPKLYPDSTVGILIRVMVDVEVAST